MRPDTNCQYQRPSSLKSATSPAREAGARMESLFPTVLAYGDFAPVDLTSAGYAQIADPMNTYESLPPGTTGASVVAIAERLGLTDVATLDRRQFTVVRPSTRMR
jgi:predicted nucleic acid-binding protein